MKPVKAAIVHDALPFYGGAERVLSAMLDVLPGTPVYTLVHNRERLAGTPLANADIRPSLSNRLPGIRAEHYRYFPLFPFAVRAIDLRGFDLVVSSHYALANWVRVDLEARHLSYVHTPLRYLYQAAGDRASGPGRLFQLAAGLARVFDRAYTKNVDSFAANSRWIGGIVRQAYGREAAVIHPPVQVDRFTAGQKRGVSFICVSRLAVHKRLEIVIAAFNRTGLPLTIVGDGPQRKRLESQAGPNIRFLGWRSDAEVAGLLGQARAFVHMAAEDFGIAVVEAQAAGCPVIGFAGGANGETVLDGETGVLVPDQSVEGLLAGIERFKATEAEFEPTRLRAHARKFDVSAFKEAFRAFLAL